MRDAEEEKARLFRHAQVVREDGERAGRMGFGRCGEMRGGEWSGWEERGEVDRAVEGGRVGA